MGKRDFKEIQGFSMKSENMTANVSMGRIRNAHVKAQYELDGRIMSDMVPYMLYVTGNFIQVTRSMSASLQGTGEVIAGAQPTGRFLYYGKVMVGERSHSPYARFGEKKVVTSRPLQYSRPTTKAFWFEEAKDRKLKNWVKVVADEFD